MEREKEGPLQFEFVETPRAIPSKKPARAKRVSDRDSLNQDLLRNKPQTAARPRTELQGYADQLAQKQGSRISQAAVPAVKPHVSSRASEPQKKSANESKDLASKFPAYRQAGVEGMTTYNPPQEDQGFNQPRIEPKPQIAGTGGMDKITTQEMSKIKSPGAQLFGQTSFEATGSGMGEYMKNLKEKIWLAWFPYLAYRYPQDFRAADVVVSMVLDAQGKVKIVRIVDSIGSDVFASYCLEAIQRASGFGPVPKEILALIGKDELEIKFGFHYR